MISFKARKSANLNVLDWQMINDDDILYYEVQRSFNGSNYETIGTVQQSMQKYSFTDNNADDRNIYYRLVMHDNAGRIRYGNVVLLKSTSSSLLNVALMPNPVRSNASLKIETGKAVSATIRIFNSLGILVSVKNVSLNKGENTISLNDITRLYDGGYEVVVNAANNSSNIKMLVNR
jgi:hypothetical protein